MSSIIMYSYHHQDSQACAQTNRTHKQAKQTSPRPLSSHLIPSSVSHQLVSSHFHFSHKARTFFYIDIKVTVSRLRRFLTLWAGRVGRAEKLVTTQRALTAAMGAAASPQHDPSMALCQLPFYPAVDGDFFCPSDAPSASASSTMLGSRHGPPFRGVAIWE
jgi:hypothetical protein